MTERVAVRAHSRRWAIAAFAVTLIVLFPFYWMVLTAMREETAVFSYPPKIWPSDLAPHLLLKVLATTDVLRWLGNTAIVAGTATLAVVPLAVLAAYALSRFRRRAVSLAAILIVVTPAAESGFSPSVHCRP